jgi:hypothetical protein
MADELEDAAARTTAIALFNETWTFIKLTERSSEDLERMLNAAYGSAYLWSRVGTPVNRARSQWQLARVWTVLGNPAAALLHARRCLELCEEHAIHGWDRPFAYEAIARAAALAGDDAERDRCLVLARELGAGIEKVGDRDYLFAELATIPR